MNSEFQQQLWSTELLDDLRQLIRLAVREDLSDQHDWTTLATVSMEEPGIARVVSRARGIVAGVEIAGVLFDEMNISGESVLHVSDGDCLESGTVLMTLTAPAMDLLTSERILLNFLGRLCGIATRTAEYVSQTVGTQAVIYDTRKTTPGWRKLEKYAVRCGGGTNHRSGLFDGVLIKDNHLAACVRALQEEDSQQAVRVALDNVEKLMASIAAANPAWSTPIPVEIEVDTLDQLSAALPLLPDIVLLDNMSAEHLQKAVSMRDALSCDVQLEASGGVTLETVRRIAETGVDRISIGALTHGSVSLDLGLDWEQS
ncbi:MAG: carboxylating nicotinate-nucleotide diphosphorylase [Planctomycetota bacterium]|nr:carboxylating nicotinate-nucleotide diphosphorylase [Planctomycetota bacterium]